MTFNPFARRSLTKSLLRELPCFPMMAAGLMAAACGSESDASRSLTRTDSAGVMISVDSTSLSALVEFGRLAQEPTVRIGALEGNPMEQFSRIAQVLSLPDGGIAVVDSRIRVIRIFEPNGDFRAELGGTGDGPGEFDFLTSAGVWSADSIAAWDFRARRISVFSVDSGFGRSFPVEPRPDRMEFALDRAPIAVNTWMNMDDGLPTADESYNRQYLIVQLLDRAGSPGDTVARLPHEETRVSVETRDGRTIVVMAPFYFGGRAEIRIASNGFWLGYSDLMELRRHGDDGSLQAILRAPGLRRPLIPEDVATASAAALAASSTPEMAESLTKRIEDSRDHPESIPAFSTFHVDSSDRIWMVEFAPRWVSPESAIVFAPDGRVLGRVALPADFLIHAITDDRILGTTTDEFDVPYVLAIPWEQLLEG